LQQRRPFGYHSSPILSAYVRVIGGGHTKGAVPTACHSRDRLAARVDLGFGKAASFQICCSDTPYLASDRKRSTSIGGQSRPCWGSRYRQVGHLPRWPSYLLTAPSPDGGWNRTALAAIGSADTSADHPGSKAESSAPESIPASQGLARACSGTRAWSSCPRAYPMRSGAVRRHPAANASPRVSTAMRT
jgi:hypothetical protein